MSAAPRNLFLVVPALNEAKVLPPTLAALRRSTPPGWSFRPLIADDGSDDDTPSVAHAAGCEVLALPRRGPGAAIAGGLRWGGRLAAAGDAIVVAEADGSCDPGLLGSLLSALDEGADVVIASRYAPGGGGSSLPRSRRALSRGCNALLGLLHPIPGVRDYTIFYRAYRPESVRSVSAQLGRLEEPGFAGNAEILLRMARAGMRVREIPHRYGSGSPGRPTRMRKLSTAAGFLRLAVGSKA